MSFDLDKEEFFETIKNKDWEFLWTAYKEKVDHSICFIILLACLFFQVVLFSLIVMIGK